MSHHLILGGSGFVGRHVASLLAHCGNQVTIVSRHSSIEPEWACFQGSVKHLTVDVTIADWDRLIEDVDVVHHYAWGSMPASANANPGGDLMTNVGLTIGLLEALRRRGGGRIVFTSSGGTVYGRVNQVPISEDHAVAPITAYGAGKATAEVYLNFYREMYGVDCRVARVANPYGAGQDLSRGLGAVTVFLHKALQGEPITIWGDGEVIRDYIHISDVAKCLVKMALFPNGKEHTFNVASGIGYSLNEVISALEKELGRTLEVNRTEMRSFDVPVNVLCIGKAKKYLGWKPMVSFSDGISKTIEDLTEKRLFSSLYL
ncbi:NAD-dependent epimerase/dehydratase family protein [Asaia sp. BMEF1]|uniref:NAD-dependent epimerase/dehydratase family protein n=1 Tax=Asaia sp. BMEF1 TaxID=3155932 RepID=UPI003F668A46